MNFANGGSDIN